ncbi:heterokaryon incompatibility protein domain-containing protein [Trichoderma sp. SZMC 28013]
MNLAVASDESFNLAKQWLEQCTGNHSSCLAYTQHPLPTRVVDVGTSSESPRLLVTNEMTAPYVALSYCWGSPQQFVTTRGSLSSMTTAIDMANVSRVIADAITVVRRLGLRYLWVDALCIVQDDESDKRAEIARMRDIYKNAYCTLIAESATDSDDGFLHQRPEPDFPNYRLPFFKSEHIYSEVYLRPEAAYEYKPHELTINTRAWTLEERLLSPRKLLYTPKQLRWECQSGEYQDGGLPRWSTKQSAAFQYAFYELLDARRLQETKEFSPSCSLAGLAKLKRFWGLLVEDYTRRECTNPKDKLRAFGGVAAEFQDIFMDDRYVAGLWRHTLLAELLWTTAGDFPLRPRPSEYRAPSWSWAAVDSPVIGLGGLLELGLSPPSSYFEIVDCETQLRSPGAPFGEVTTGRLVVRGHMRYGKLHYDASVKYDRYTVRSATKRGEHDSPILLLASLDALGDDRHVNLCCVWVHELYGKAIGLLVVPGNDSESYRRIGTFRTSEGKDDDDVKEWFMESEIRNIVII